MKFIKNGGLYETDKSNECKISKITEDEKIMTISVVVPKDFNGTYCQKCPIWCDSISCSVIGICPLNDNQQY
ncbi:hypothetical protein HMPREF9469_01836 [ [[Clostridium] citroniae WAL-17108]|jgi:hypothetical protein|uniref:Uncharacterized protein n=2 Tax=Enterocloster citroniae TaxID=358743 RepID=G5HGR7_9FIRM|nr:hypothetical protein [Enterocloster citroniae]EHE99267.1 hypothetical protein HMPREF9469_01836 [ [[Clostridium] citroniae WAL-17108]DAZ16470.1 MAG TPA: hypothetical protein [Caudoviricetes sp.]